ERQLEQAKRRANELAGAVADDYAALGSDDRSPTSHNAPWESTLARSVLIAASAAAAGQGMHRGDGGCFLH
ncbi:MAG: hypothetical protein ACREU5_06795, partial [Burkholderiales bacterium]